MRETPKVDKAFIREGMERVYIIQELISSTLGFPDTKDGSVHPAVHNYQCRKYLKKAIRNLSKLYQEMGEWNPDPIVVDMDDFEDAYALDRHSFDGRGFTRWVRNEGVPIVFKDLPTYVGIQVMTSDGCIISGGWNDTCWGWTVPEDDPMHVFLWRFYKLPSPLSDLKNPKLVAS